jgi:ABC-type Fe3+/spermidine/putrescine transport system ATPase subunit
MSHLVVQDLVKSYDNGTRAVDGVSLAVERGEIVSLLGPSGCGKTTTLRCIGGLEVADSGSIRVGDRTLFSRGQGQGVNVAPEKRRMAMVFQQYALWPHFDVFENVAFGLKSQKVPRAEIPEKVGVALRRVQLWEQRHRRIGQLSGGQQQRVALARAFAADPDIVLFDEPLSNLDSRLREGMRLELVELQQSMGFTAVYVTHDQDEAFNLSSHIVVMNKGRIEQIGTPWEVWHQPRSAFVANFLGSVNRFSGTVTGSSGAMVLETTTGIRIGLGRRDDLRVGATVDAFVRFGAIEVYTAEPGLMDNVWKAHVKIRAFQGDTTMLRVAFGGGELACRATQLSTAEIDHIYVHIVPSAVLCYETDSSES